MNPPSKGGRYEIDPKNGQRTHVQKPTGPKKPAEESAEQAPNPAETKGK